MMMKGTVARRTRSATRKMGHPNDRRRQRASTMALGDAGNIPVVVRCIEECGSSATAAVAQVHASTSPTELASRWTDRRCGQDTAATDQDAAEGERQPWPRRPPPRSCAMAGPG